MRKGTIGLIGLLLIGLSIISIISVTGFADVATTEADVPDVAADVVSKWEVVGGVVVTEITPNPGGLVEVRKCAVVCDDNGLDDLADSVVEAEVYDPDGALFDYEPSLTPVTGDECIDPNPYPDKCVIYTGTFTMQSTDLPDFYTVKVWVDSGEPLTNQFQYLTCILLELDAGTIEFGLITPGNPVTVSGDTDFATTDKPTVKNLCNVVTDAQIYGIDMTGAGTMPVGNIEDQFNALGLFALSVDPGRTETGLNLGPGLMQNLDFKLTPPVPLPVGSYSGTVTVLGVASAD